MANIDKYNSPEEFVAETGKDILKGTTFALVGGVIDAGVDYISPALPGFNEVIMAARVMSTLVSDQPIEKKQAELVKTAARILIVSTCFMIPIPFFNVFVGGLAGSLVGRIIDQEAMHN